MIHPAWMLGLALWGQVPAPPAAGDGAAALRAERRGILDREAKQLSALADRLAGEGHADEAAEGRGRIEPADPAGGPSRFVPLPELVPAGGRGLANVPAGAAAAPARRAEVRDVEAATPKALFDLSARAAAPGPQQSFGLAVAC